MMTLIQEAIGVTPSQTDHRQRLKPLERADPDQLPSLRLTERDLQIVKTVYQYRAMSAVQIEQLFFAGETEKSRQAARLYAARATKPIKQPGIGKRVHCQRRLRLLFHHGYLWRDEQPTKLSEGRKPFVYRIDERAMELLPDLLDVEPEMIEWDPRENTVSGPFLEHLLRTNDVRVAITLACQQHGLAIEHWIDDKTLKRTHAQDKVTITGPKGAKTKTTVIPDGYFHLRNDRKEEGKKNQHHFLEADLATVVGQRSKWGRKDWVRKIQAYIAYHKSGMYRKRYGTNSLIILTVTTSERRAQTLKTITEEAGGKGHFWFTTFDQVTPQAVLTEPIWQVACRDTSEPLMW
jgi:hypothetical protein